ncbi:hypothetical protein [Paraburkholderia sp. GAS334]|uniref:hypothetical protein n=1 Tax=Paraburkholderia sp. GAS334 TaxID=3035131 RepID=UPI003D246B61
MSLQSAIDVVTPIAKVEIFSLAMVPSALLALLAGGCAIALYCVLAASGSTGKGDKTPHD